MRSVESQGGRYPMPDRLIVVALSVGLCWTWGGVGNSEEKQEVREAVTIRPAGEALRGEVAKVTATEVVLKLANGVEQSIPVSLLRPTDIYTCRRQLIAPRDAKGFWELGEYCLENGVNDGAEKMFEAAFQLEPETYRARYAEALKTQQAAVAKKPARNGNEDHAALPRFGIRHPGGLHTQEEISRTRKLVAEGGEPWTSAYRQFRTEARKSLEQTPHAVEMFIIPPFADDYQGYMKVCQPFMDECYAAYACALAYQLESDPDSRKRYAEKALEIVNAWGRTNKGFKAKAESYHRKSGWTEPFVRYQLVSSESGVGLIFAAELMADFEGWKKEDRAAFSKWVGEVYRPEADGIQAWENGSNWVCWGTLASIASAHLLDDGKAMEQDIGLSRKWIENHIAEDGHLPAEMARGESGLWYTYYALASMTAACQIAHNATGVDLFHYKAPNGRSMKLALDYLFKNCNDPSGWPTGKQRACGAGGYLDKSSFPRIWWGANLFEAMAAVYGDERYGTFVATARPVTMTARHHNAWSFPTLMRPDPGGGGKERNP